MSFLAKFGGYKISGPTTFANELVVIVTLYHKIVHLKSSINRGKKASQVDPR